MTDRDPVMLSRLAGATRTWRSANEAVNDERAKLNAAIKAAKQAGYSYADIREVTGLGTLTIQTILGKGPTKKIAGE